MRANPTEYTVILAGGPNELAVDERTGRLFVSLDPKGSMGGIGWFF